MQDLEKKYRGRLFPLSIHINDFNCCGFALGIPAWVSVGSDCFTNVEDGLTDSDDYDEELVKLLREDGYTHIRLINDKSELKEGEHLAILKFDVYNRDYHFIREYEGEFIQKLGEGPITKVEGTYQEILDNDWVIQNVTFSGPASLLAVSDMLPSIECVYDGDPQCKIYIPYLKNSIIEGTYEYTKIHEIFESLDGAISYCNRRGGKYDILEVCAIDEHQKPQYRIYVDDIASTLPHKYLIHKKGKFMDCVDMSFTVDAMRHEANYKVIAVHFNMTKQNRKSLYYDRLFNKPLNFTLEGVLYPPAEIISELDYNCYGFAFQDFTFESFDEVFEDFSYQEVPLDTKQYYICKENFVLDGISNEIYKRHKGKVRQIFNPYLIDKDEYLVLLRYCPKSEDFHFIMYNSGLWLEKQGCKPVSFIDTNTDPTKDPWDWYDKDTYLQDSTRIVMFAVKKNIPIKQVITIKEKEMYFKLPPSVKEKSEIEFILTEPQKVYSTLEQLNTNDKSNGRICKITRDYLLLVEDWRDLSEGYINDTIDESDVEVRTVLGVTHVDGDIYVCIAETEIITHEGHDDSDEINCTEVPPIINSF